MCGEFKLPFPYVLPKWAWLLLGLLAHVGLPAQWSFLGDPLISAGAVTSQSLALSPDWHPHLAFTSGGAVYVERFDGSQWGGVTTAGLPMGGLNGCALAFSTGGKPCLAVAPALGVYVLDSLGWDLLPGLPSLAHAQGLQLRAAPAGKLWLAWFKAGATDTTYVYTHSTGSGWQQEGMLEGRVVDLELDDVGEPMVLLAHADAILHQSNGTWQPLPQFLYPDEDYIALQMSYDGTSTGAMVMRRDTSLYLSVELLSLGNWVQLGTAGFTVGGHADLGLSYAGIPHVVSVDHLQEGPPKAYQYVAGNWQLLGGQFVYNNTVSQPQWAHDPGAAYLVFRDEEQNQRNSVMYLGTPNGSQAQVSSSRLQLWPNPVADVLHVELERPLPQGEAWIMDALGRILRRQPLGTGKAVALDVGALPSGGYFLLLQGTQVSLHGSFLKRD